RNQIFANNPSALARLTSGLYAVRTPAVEAGRKQWMTQIGRKEMHSASHVSSKNPEPSKDCARRVAYRPAGERDGANASAGGNVPQPQRVVRRCRERQAAVRREGAGEDPISMSLEHGAGGAGGDIPQPQRVVCGCREHQAAV